MTPSRLQRSLRTTFLGLATNAVFATAKMLAGTFGHSHALIADAVEAMADVFSSIVVWRGVVVAEEPPDEDHPYGHGNVVLFVVVVVLSLLLFVAVRIVIGAIQ